MRVLISGATGFVGRRILADLSGLGASADAAAHEVYALARTGASEGCGGSVTWIESDLSDLQVGALPSELDAVIYLAQSARYREFPAGAGDMLRVNVDSPLALIEHAAQAGATQFVYASSGGVYGYNPEPAQEADLPRPMNFYLASKYAAELLLTQFASQLDVVVVRPYFVYGPGQSGMLIANLVEKVLAGASIEIDGEPGMRINPIHVEDAADAILAVLGRRGSDVFNLAGDEIVTITDLVELIGEEAGTNPAIKHRPERPVGDLLGANEHMKKALGIGPLRGLRAGVSEVVAAARGA